MKDDLAPLLRAAADRALADHRLARSKVRDEKKGLKEAKEKVRDAEESQILVQTLAKKVQEQAHERIASIVSRCLASVFDDPYEFRVVFERKRGRTEARLGFVRNDNEIDPTSAAGGGVVDVAAFALRLACLMLRRPKVRRLLVLDEPFRFVSQEYRERVRDLLLTLSQEMKVQIVLVTHVPELQVGKVVELG